MSLIELPIVTRTVLEDIPFETTGKSPFIEDLDPALVLQAHDVMYQKGAAVLSAIAMAASIEGARLLTPDNNWQRSELVHGPGALEREYLAAHPSTARNAQPYVSLYATQRYTSPEDTLTKQTTVGFGLSANRGGLQRLTIAYALARSFSQEWRATAPAQNPDNSSVRSLADTDEVTGTVRAPLSILRGIMLRDFTLAAQNPGLLRAIVPNATS